MRLIKKKLGTRSTFLPDPSFRSVKKGLYLDWNFLDRKRGAPSLSKFLRKYHIIAVGVRRQKARKAAARTDIVVSPILLSALKMRMLMKMLTTAI